MSKDNYPQYADTVSADFVKEMCKDESAKFAETLENADICFDEFCAYKHQEMELNTESDEQVDEIDAMWEKLVNAFDRETGLELSVVFAESMERTDELEGGAFAVDGVYQRTPAGEKHKDSIIRKVWNIFG